MYPVSTMIMMTVTILLVAFVVTAVHACHPRTVGEILVCIRYVECRCGKFMQSIKSVLSDLKIRASYGVNGNQPGALYGYMGLYSYGQNYMGGGGSYESALPNPNLKWEKNYNLNLGLDLAFINRIFVSLEYYNRDTKDLLYNRPISSTTGFQNYLGNLGQLNNRGWELELRTINFAGSNFNWTSV